MLKFKTGTSINEAGMLKKHSSDTVLLLSISKVKVNIGSFVARPI